MTSRPLIGDQELDSQIITERPLSRAVCYAIAIISDAVGFRPEERTPRWTFMVLIQNAPRDSPL